MPRPKPTVKKNIPKRDYREFGRYGDFVDKPCSLVLNGKLITGTITTIDWYKITLDCNGSRESMYGIRAVVNYDKNSIRKIFNVYFDLRD
jgi:hypothetical protein